jgi:hypothetical protein
LWESKNPNRSSTERGHSNSAIAIDTSVIGKKMKIEKQNLSIAKNAKHGRREKARLAAG